MTWLLVFAVMLLVVLGMALGVLFGRKPIAGSCGGIANLTEQERCALCGGTPKACPQPKQ